MSEVKTEEDVRIAYCDTHDAWFPSLGACSFCEYEFALALRVPIPR